MSGRNAAEAIAIMDDDQNIDFDFDDEVDVQRYALEEHDDDDEPVIYNDEKIDASSVLDTQATPVLAPIPQEIELPSCRHSRHEIRPNTVVELKDHSGRQSRHLISGDFLLVRHIIEVIQTEKTRLRGYRLRRCSYLQPTFDRKLNDVFMVIEVKEHDESPRFYQGLIDVDSDEIVRIRHCTFTNLSWGALNFTHVNFSVPPGIATQEQVQRHYFDKGALVCRWVHIVHLHPNGISYGGEIRRIYKREVSDFSDMRRIPGVKGIDDRATQSLSSSLSSSFSSSTSPSSSSSSSSSSCTSLLAADKSSHSKRPDHQEPTSGEFNNVKDARKKRFGGRKFTLADIFCCSGGTSAGAQEAGYCVKLGLDNDAFAMSAYRRNFPNAMHYEMDAAEFPQIARRSVHSCDHVHMSCPCCFWSISHSVDGKNDDKNIATLFMVEEFLKTLKPVTFSLEQAPGLLQIKKHQPYFRRLVNGILSKGYNVRYVVHDQAWFGNAQHRRRLIFVGSRIGLPIPPFPPPICGPPGSGLQRFKTIEDALMPLERQLRFDDPYHRPANLPPRNEPAIDPHVNLAKTITCNGGINFHHTGKRDNTVRELSMFQGFRLCHHFAGSMTEAKRQCGNAWPPVSNKEYFKVWAAHMEAFNNGFIDAEDEVLNLWNFLEGKGIAIPRPSVIDVDAIGSASDLRSQSPPFRYLTKLEKPVKPCFPLPLWANSKSIDPIPQRSRQLRERDTSSINAMHHEDKIFQEHLRHALKLSRQDKKRRETLEKISCAQQSGDIMDLT